MIYRIVAVLFVLAVVFILYPVQAVLIGAGGIILALAWGVYRMMNKSRKAKQEQEALQHRRTMEVLAEQRRQVKEARLQQAHLKKMGLSSKDDSVR